MGDAPSEPDPASRRTVCPACGSPHAWQGICPACALGIVLDPPAEEPVSAPATLGNYELLSEIGRGGMGRVWRARQRGTRRDIALKLLLGGAFAHEAARERLRREAIATARLRHPGIVTIHEVGEGNDELFLSMELVEGDTLAHRLKAGPIPPREAAALARDLGNALQHAHDHGVIHRDLKPSNILLDRARDGAPRLVDFGIARLVDNQDTLTHTLGGMGTLAYLAPEQAAGRRIDQGPATDVYGLGAVLYHCLTGRPPFLGETSAALLRALSETDAPSPRSFNPGIPRDLETLCLKCLEKSPSHRYPTAAALVNDLNHFLADRPIQARPLDPLTRAARWCRRRPAVATALVTVALATGLVAYFGLRAERASRVRLNYLVRAVNTRARDAFASGDAAEALALLAQSLRRQPADVHSAGRLATALRDRPWARPLFELAPHPGHLLLAAWSPDGQVILTACDDGRIRRWNAGTGAPLDGGWQHLGESARQLGFSADGRWVLSVLFSGSLDVWNAQSAALALDLPPPASVVADALFQPHHQAIASVRAEGAVELWDLERAVLERRFLHPAPVFQFAFNPAGDLLATACDDGQARVWNVQTGEAATTPLPLGAPLRGIHFHPDGRRLAVTTSNRVVVVWNLDGGGISPPLEHHGAAPARFSPEGALLLQSSPDGAVTALDPTTRNARWHVTGDRRVPAFGWVFSPKGDRLVVGRDGREVMTLLTRDGGQLSEPIATRWETEWVEFSPDGSRLVLCAGTNAATVWRLPIGSFARPRIDLDPGVLDLQFSPDSRHLNVCRGDGTLDRISLDRPVARTSLRLPGNGLARGAFSSDATLVATIDAASTPTLAVHETQSGTSIAGPWRLPGAAGPLAFSPDHRWLAATTDAAQLLVFEVGSDRPAGPLDLRPSPTDPGWGPRVFSVEFSRDSRRLAVGTYGGMAWIFDANPPHQARGLPHPAPVPAARFSPDGDRLAVACFDGRVRVWDARTGRNTGIELVHDDVVHDLAFTSDGRRVVTSSGDRTLRTWDAQSGALVAKARESGAFQRIAVHPTRPILSATAETRPVHVWDAGLGLPLSEPLPVTFYSQVAEFSPDGHWLALFAASGPGVVFPLSLPTPPAPDWLAPLAEAVAGMRFSEDDTVHVVSPAERIALEAHLRAKAGGVDGEWDRWLREFLE